MLLLLLAFGLGIVAGLRSMTPPAVVAWAARLGHLDLAPTPLDWLGSAAAAWLLAAAALGEDSLWRRWTSRLAAPLAGLMLLLVYTQGAFGLMPLKNDPVARILGRTFRPVADSLSATASHVGAQAVLTTDYETTAWLRFNQPGIKVIQVNEPQRYPQAPAAGAGLLQRPLIYLTEFRRDQHPVVQRLFGYTGFPTQMQTPSSLYMVYPVGRPKSSQLGKMP